MPRKKKTKITLADVQDPGSHSMGVDNEEELFDRGIVRDSDDTATATATETDLSAAPRPDHPHIPVEVMDRLRRGIEDGLRAEAFERSVDGAVLGYYYVPGRPLMGNADVTMTREEAAKYRIPWPRNVDLIRVIF